MAKWTRARKTSEKTLWKNIFEERYETYPIGFPVFPSLAKLAANYQSGTTYSRPLFIRDRLPITKGNRGEFHPPRAFPVPGLSSLFPGENFVRSGSFSTETPYKITFFVQARSSFPCRWLQSITKTALSDVGEGRLEGEGLL